MGARVLGIDFETTGLDSGNDRIIECGAVLFDWDDQRPLQIMSELVDPDIPVPEEITALTGITTNNVIEFGILEEDMLDGLDLMMEKAEYVMAYNQSFDHGFYDAAVKRYGRKVWSKEWLCGMEDIVYPSHIQTRKLTYIAAEYGIINPFQHRAVFDVLTMFKVASHFELADIIARSREQTFYVQAVVSFDDKEKAKELFFRWHGPSKRWWKSMKESDYAAMKDTCGFRTQLLDGPLE